MRYRGPRGLTAKQLSVLVLAGLLAIIAMTISVQATRLGVPVGQQMHQIVFTEEAGAE